MLATIEVEVRFLPSRTGACLIIDSKRLWENWKTWSEVLVCLVKAIQVLAEWIWSKAYGLKLFGVFLSLLGTR